MITAVFGAGCAATLALAWPRREERAFALLLTASWLATLGVVRLPPASWSYAAVAIDSVGVVVAAAGLAIMPRLWLGAFSAAAVLQLGAHLTLQASDGSMLDRWRYLAALDALFAVQLAAVATPGLLRLLARARPATASGAPA